MSELGRWGLHVCPLHYKKQRFFSTGFGCRNGIGISEGAVGELVDDDG